MAGARVEQQLQQHLQHVVFLTFPAHGHVNPALQLAKLLIDSGGFKITFAVGENIAPKLRQELAAQPAYASLIEIATLSFSRRPPQPPATSFAAVMEFLNSTRPSFESLLGDIINCNGNWNDNCDGSRHGGVSCIIADCFVTWSHDVTAEFEIPSIRLFIADAHVFSALLQVDAIDAKIAAAAAGDLNEQVIDFIPGVQPLMVKDLPQSLCEHRSFAREVIKGTLQGTGLILNTIYELETGALEAIQSAFTGGQRVYVVGPMMLMQKIQVVDLQTNGSVISEEMECLKWLDTKPDSSVLFVCFGSVAKITNEQVREIAIGLERSKQTFLWVIRTTPGDLLSDILPQGFLERTKERGLIIKWAPQLQVLSHLAIGGFITHCGWNSIMENLSLRAIPMICWPQMADQKLNARILVDEWKVGYDLVAHEDGMMKAETIAKAATDVMEEDVRSKLKARSLQLRHKLISATDEGGSSRDDMQALLQNIKTHHVNMKA